MRSETLPNGEPRFQLLETIREFALNAFAGLPDQALTQVRQRQAEYFLRLIEATYSVGIRELVRMMDVEQHNARAALRWLLDHGDPLTGKLAWCMGEYFGLVGSLSEGRRTLAQLPLK